MVRLSLRRAKRMLLVWVGLVLGTISTVWGAPPVCTRKAELMETLAYLITIQERVFVLLIVGSKHVLVQ